MRAAAPPAQTEVLQAAALPLACLQTGSDGLGAATGCVDPSGVSRLAWEARRRTSILAALSPGVVRPQREALSQAPIVIWQGSGAPAPLGAEAQRALGQWLSAGGMLLVDAADPVGSASRDAFLRGAEAALAGALGPRAPSPVDANHVLYRSFYLLRERGFARPLARALTVQGRLAVVVSPEPWLTALATESDGRFAHPSAAPSDADREQVVRMSINWLMYALCLNYKDDQVHLPYLLERRGRP